jgi:hypothetical protein
MNTKPILLLSLALAGLAAPLARAQVDFSADIQLGRRPPPPPPAVVVVVPDSGPSPWEHGSWYQPSQDYYYYPGAQVYYRVHDHVWFYNDRGTWRNGPFLPVGFRVDFGRSIPLRMATNRPYRFHEQIVGRYPGNYFETRVRFRDDRRDDRHDDRHDDHGHDHDHDHDNH